jgi:GT2 family glycosyltransferase
VRTAIVATVRNESAHITEFLSSLEVQSRKPDIIVITDGGSTDDTPQKLADYAKASEIPFRWSSVPGNRSQGRNAAVRICEAELIAATDVSVLDPTWFERIIAPLERGKADVVAGWYELLVDSPRERAVGLLTQWSIDQVHPETFLPSSRSIAFTRVAWAKVGGYPEDLATTEDTVFDLRLRAAGLRFVFDPKAVVRWRPATTTSAAYQMYRQFAESDGQAGIFLISYSRYGLVYGAYIGAAALLVLGFLWWPLWLLLLLGGIAYLLFRIRKVLRAGLWRQVPYAIAVGFALDAAMLTGYVRGRQQARRLRHSAKT